MRRFMLASPKFTGSIELVFQDSIVCVDFRNAQMDLTQKRWLLDNCPLLVDGIEFFLKGTAFTCVEADFEVTFDMFWDKYAFKVDRKRAKAIWDKLPKSKQVAAYYGIDKYDRYLKRTDWRNKCEPKTYLLNERWENEWK